MKKSIRYLSIIMVITILLTAYSPVLAKKMDNVKEDNKNLEMILESEDKLIYTYNENGKLYKNIDETISLYDSKTTKFIFENGEFREIDQLMYKIDPKKLVVTIISLYSNKIIEERSFDNVIRIDKEDAIKNFKEDTIENNVVTYRHYNWKFFDAKSGFGTIENLSINSIARILSIAVGLSGIFPLSVFFSAASAMYNYSLTRAYYYMIVSRDNKYKLAPAFRYEISWYKDRYHSKSGLIKSQTLIHDPIR